VRDTQQHTAGSQTGRIDLSEFPTLEKGNVFESFRVGQVFSHHWGRTLTRGDNVVFSTAMCYWNPLLLNVTYAEAQGHPDTPINPMLVLCTAVGMSVEDLSERSAAFLGVDDCQFHKSIYPGDTLRAESEVVTCRRSASRPGEGIVGWRTHAFNQRDDLVLSYLRTNIVKCASESVEPTVGSRA
jgi:itaconyl-CoA hydratase